MAATRLRQPVACSATGQQLVSATDSCLSLSVASMASNELFLLYPLLNKNKKKRAKGKKESICIQCYWEEWKKVYSIHYTIICVQTKESTSIIFVCINSKASFIRPDITGMDWIH